MDTNKGNIDLSAGKSWAEQTEVELSKVKEINECNTERYFIVKHKDGSFDRTSPFLIQKAIQGLVGEPKSIKKIRSGDLMIEVHNSQQAANLKKCTHFANIPVSVSPHKTLNTSRGVISESDLLYITEEEITENLKEENVIQAYRIKIYRQDEKDPSKKVQVPTKHIILTFNTPNLPKSIKAGYLSCSVRPYIPNPLRCFRCQRYGHSKNSCRGKITCGRCAGDHESIDCKAPPHCVNCKKDHPSYAKSCEKWIKEKEIQTIRTKQNISYPEARKLVESRTPIAGISYAAATSKSVQKHTKTIATQTEQTTENNLPSKPKKINKISSNPNLTSRSAYTTSDKSSKPSTSKAQNKSQSKSSSNLTKPGFSRPPVHKRQVQSKHNLTTDKSSTFLVNNSKKKKSNPKSVNNAAKPIADDSDVLDITPVSDLSDNEEVMSTTSDINNVDTYI